MEIFAIDITSWTASFRYPRLISGPQLSVDVPPLSTVLGLINAAAGRYIDFKKFKIGYYFSYGGKGTDIETIYLREVNKNGKVTNNTFTNAVKREFLFDTFLRIYTQEVSVAAYFEEPYYPLLLGRSSDLATVGNIKHKKLEKIIGADKVRGQIIPHLGNMLPGTVQALPKYFTDTIPKQYLGFEPYSVLDHKKDVKTDLVGYRDQVNGREVDIYFHEIDCESLY